MLNEHGLGNKNVSIANIMRHWKDPIILALEALVLPKVPQRTFLRGLFWAWIHGFNPTAIHLTNKEFAHRGKFMMIKLKIQQVVAVWANDINLVLYKKRDPKPII